MTDAHEVDENLQDFNQHMEYEQYFKQRLTALLDDPVMVERVKGAFRPYVLTWYGRTEEHEDVIEANAINAAIAAIKEAAGV